MKSGRWEHFLPRFFALLASLVLVLLLTVLFSFTTGSAAITPQRILDILGTGTLGPERSILLEIRLPRILLAVAVGGALSLSGVLLQGIFRNPLVEPYTLGIAGGAALGVCLAILLKPADWLGIYLLPVAGFCGALLILTLLYSFSLRRGAMRLEDLLLTGVMVSFVTSSGLMLSMAISRAHDLQTIIFWTMGSLSRAEWPIVWFTLAGSLMGLIFSFFLSRNLNVLALGEEEAIHLGVSVERTKRYAFFWASLLTGIAIAAGGVIGFVGLVVPHLMRRLVGPDHRILIPVAYLMGAVFLLWSDTAARMVISPLELPVGVITGIVGGSLFIGVLAWKRRSS